MVRSSRRAEKVPLIPTTTKVDSAGVASRRDALRGTSLAGAAPSKKVISIPDVTGAVLVVLLAVVSVAVALTAHSRRDPAVKWEAATAYPYTPLSVARYTTADVLRTAREGRWFRLDPRREATFARDPTAWLADPTDLTVFSWEDGVFSMNVLRPAPGELGPGAAPPEVSDDILAMWREHRYADLAAVGGAGHAKVYDAFVALAYTAQAYAPGRFKKGQPPFHVVTHQREYLSPECLRDVPKGSRFNPCPAARRWAPVLNFGANPKTAAVFPTAVKMPDVDFIATVLRNERASDTNANANATGRGRSVNLAAAAEDAESESSPLGLDESALDRLRTPASGSNRGRNASPSWRGAARTCPSRRRCPSAPIAWTPRCAERCSWTSSTSPRGGGSRALAPERRRRVLRRRGRAAAPRHRRGARGVDGIATRASHEPRDDSEVARGDALRRRQRKSRRRQGERLGDSGDSDDSVSALSSSKVLGGEWLDARFTDIDSGPCGDALPLALRGDPLTHAQRQHYKYALDTGGVGAAPASPPSRRWRRRRSCSGWNPRWLISTPPTCNPGRTTSPSPRTSLIWRRNTCGRSRTRRRRGTSPRGAPFSRGT